MINEPYVKEYDKDGLVSNLITKNNPYINQYPKQVNHKTRFRGNNKGNAIVIIGSLKYFKVLQTIVEPDTIQVKMRGGNVKLVENPNSGLVRTIEHSILK